MRNIRFRAAFRVSLAGAFVMAGYEIVRSTASSLFILHYGASRLPYVLLMVPLIMVLGTYAFSVGLRKLGPYRLFQVSLFLASLMMVLFSWTAQAGLTFALFLYYLFGQAYIVFLVEEVWAFLNSTLSEEEGKRFNGAIIGLSTLGSVVGGLVTGRLSPVLGSEIIITLASLLTLLGGFIGSAAFRIAPPQVGKGKEPQRLRDHFAWDLFHRDSLILRLTLVVASAQIISTLLDVGFHKALETKIPLLDPRTAFLGYFWAAVNFAGLFIQFFATPLILRKLAPRKVHGAIPLLHALFALGALFSPTLIPMAIAFFLFKTVDYSLFRAAKELLYIPLSFTARYRAKMVVDALVYRSAKGVASGFLTLLSLVGAAPSMVFFPGASLCFALFWFSQSRRLTEGKRG